MKFDEKVNLNSSKTQTWKTGEFYRQTDKKLYEIWKHSMFSVLSLTEDIRNSGDKSTTISYKVYPENSLKICKQLFANNNAKLLEKGMLFSPSANDTESINASQSGFAIGLKSALSSVSPVLKNKVELEVKKMAEQIGLDFEKIKEQARTIETTMQEKCFENMVSLQQISCRKTKKKKKTMASLVFAASVMVFASLYPSFKIDIDNISVEIERVLDTDFYSHPDFSSKMLTKKEFNLLGFNEAMKHAFGTNWKKIFESNLDFMIMLSSTKTDLPTIAKNEAFSRLTNGVMIMTEYLEENHRDWNMLDYSQRQEFAKPVALMLARMNRLEEAFLVILAADPLNSSLHEYASRKNIDIRELSSKYFSREKILDPEINKQDPLLRTVVAMYGGDPAHAREAINIQLANFFKDQFFAER